jgi:hypothetical protein
MDLRVAALPRADWNLSISPCCLRLYEFVEPEARDHSQWLVCKRQATVLVNYHSYDPVAPSQPTTDRTPGQSDHHLPFKQSMNSSDAPSSASAFISSRVGRCSKDSLPRRWSKASVRVCRTSSLRSLDRSLISFIWLVVEIRNGTGSDFLSQWRHLLS